MSIRIYDGDCIMDSRIESVSIHIRDSLGNTVIVHLHVPTVEYGQRFVGDLTCGNYQDRPIHVTLSGMLIRECKPNMSDRLIFGASARDGAP